MGETASQAISAFNAGREPQRRAMKMAAMRNNAFSFLRGTCHLFHQRMHERKLAPEGPIAWQCGDLHLENFGTYLGDNSLTYFDINDFDEAILAPHSWDILRLATSILVAAPTLGLKGSSGKDQARQLVERYYAELSLGKPRWIERKTADGPIGDMIDSLKKRDAVKFLNKRAPLNGGIRALIIDGHKTLALDPGDATKLAAFCSGLAKSSAQPKSIGFIDAARRGAGTGSLGIPRFVVLVEGAGSPDGNWLLDLKAAMPSAVAPYVLVPQPRWSSEAHRMVAIQTLFQAHPPGSLSAEVYQRAPFLLRQMQPSADRLNLNAIAAKPASFDKVIGTMASLTAWGHLRAASCHGSATVDALMAAAGERKTVKGILDRAQALADLNASDWAEYCEAFDRGELKAA